MRCFGGVEDVTRKPTYGKGSDWTDRSFRVRTPAHQCPDETKTWSCVWPPVNLLCTNEYIPYQKIRWPRLHFKFRNPRPTKVVLTTQKATRRDTDILGVGDVSWISRGTIVRPYYGLTFPSHQVLKKGKDKKSRRRRRDRPHFHLGSSRSWMI